MKKLLVFVAALMLFSLSVFAEEKMPYTDKIALGIDVFKSKAVMRFWQGDNFAIDAYAGLSYRDATTVSLGGGVALPVFNAADVYGYFVGGAGFGLAAYSQTGLTSTGISFGINAGIELEVFLTPLSKNLSIASAVGMTAGMTRTENKITIPGDEHTDVENEFYFGLAEGAAVNSLIIRYYF
ncbi:MAG: hypothetical protein CVV21_11075 [Candidatus Goldiibacteriota bacterium HGW-Goldbacteria-1]|jgi:hypothetical protein|nr:MAG: hypothetical protein CVV21_11075 [Candidatus Goldiibacteriota bacterium HGW-Goldbacteria-1]